MLLTIRLLYLLCVLILVHNEKIHINREHLKHPYTFKTKNYQIVIPKRVNPGGVLLSHAVDYSDHGGEPEDLHLSMPIDRKDHHLHLRPTRRILSPSATMDVFKHSKHPEIKHKFGHKRRHCHYSGHVKGHRRSRSSISTCNGLEGYIQTDDGLFMIEPVHGHNRDHALDIPHPHRVYRHSTNSSNSNSKCSQFEGETCKKKPRRNADVDVLSEYYMELLLVLDHSFLQYHKDIDVEDYVLTIMNMARDLFLDETLGITINVVIVRLIRLENEEHEMNLDGNHNIEKTMQYFLDWQKRINPREDSHPNHHDLAILFTRTDICNNDKTCGFMGASRFGGMCDEDNSGIIVRDNGLLTGFVIAHEIGHTMTLVHDFKRTSFEFSVAEKRRFTTTVMSPEITGDIFEWSKCSSERLKTFMKYDFGNCLTDEPTEHTFRIADTLPGVMFDGDYQCKTIFGPNAALCVTGIDCENLICFVEDKGCIETYTKPAQGTHCDEHKWCFHGKCVEEGERPDVVHGNWSEWHEWSDCSRTCGSGVAKQRRTCNNPPPKNGGKFCMGDSVRYKICSTDPCDDNQPSFRDVQCADFNSWMYPGDGEMHTWLSYPAHDENPCALYCVNERGSVASLKTRVIDGTSCYRSVRHVCINGLCKEIPCDLNLGSGAVDDRCGVCKGDGTSCEVITAEVTLVCSSVYENEKRLVAIPAKSFNIKIESMKPSATKFQIRNANESDVLLDGTYIGVSKVYNTTAWVGMIRQNQEAINIPGPIPMPISVWAYVDGNSTVKYTFGIPAKSKLNPQFNWEFVHWSPCSAECGPGVQESPARCVEASAGLVSDHHCKGVLQPTALIRPCEIAPCTPRWFIGDWTSCIHCPSGTQYRIVKCYRPVGSDEGELDFISDAYCSSNKPSTSKACACTRRKREATEDGLQHNNNILPATEIKAVGNIMVVVQTTASPLTTAALTTTSLIETSSNNSSIGNENIKELAQSLPNNQSTTTAGSNNISVAVTQSSSHIETTCIIVNATTTTTNNPLNSVTTTSTITTSEVKNLSNNTAVANTTEVSNQDLEFTYNSTSPFMVVNCSTSFVTVPTLFENGTIGDSSKSENLNIDNSMGSDILNGAENATHIPTENSSYREIYLFAKIINDTAINKKAKPTNETTENTTISLDTVQNGITIASIITPIISTTSSKANDNTEYTTVPSETTTNGSTITSIITSTISPTISKSIENTENTTLLSDTTTNGTIITTGTPINSTTSVSSSQNTEFITVFSDTTTNGVTIAPTVTPITSTTSYKSSENAEYTTVFSDITRNGTTIACTITPITSTTSYISSENTEYTTVFSATTTNGTTIVPSVTPINSTTSYTSSENREYTTVSSDTTSNGTTFVPTGIPINSTISYTSSENAEYTTVSSDTTPNGTTSVPSGTPINSTSSYSSSENAECTTVFSDTTTNRTSIVPSVTPINSTTSYNSSENTEYTTVSSDTTPNGTTIIPTGTPINSTTSYKSSENTETITVLSDTTATIGPTDTAINSTTSNKSTENTESSTVFQNTSANVTTIGYAITSMNSTLSSISMPTTLENLNSSTSPLMEETKPTTELPPAVNSTLQQTETKSNTGITESSTNAELSVTTPKLELASNFSMVCHLLPLQKANHSANISTFPTTAAGSESHSPINNNTNYDFKGEMGRKRNPSAAEIDKIVFLTTTTSEKPRRMTPPNVKTLYDFIDIPRYKLTVHAQKGDLAAYSPNSGRKINSSTFDMCGMDALKFLHSIQRDFANNKTRI